MDPLHIIDNAMSEAVRRGGSWIACRPGCTTCCLGPVEITTADADRLRAGLAQLDPAEAALIRDRARTCTGGDDEPCPVLNLGTGLCRLYDYRPLLCRTFGPATRIGSSIGVCHLCFDGATDDQVAAAAVDLDPALFDSPAGFTITQAFVISD